MACTGFLENANTLFKITIPSPPTLEIQNSTITLVLYGVTANEGFYEVIISSTPPGYTGPVPSQVYTNWTVSENGVDFTGQQLYDLADHNRPGGLGDAGADVQGAKFTSDSVSCEGIIGSSFATFDSVAPQGIVCFGSAP